MNILLQISGTHFGTERPPVVEALVTLARLQRPDLMLLSGDITQRARAAQCSPDLMVVCVNTTRSWRHRHGEISGLQVDRMARLLEGAEPSCSPGSPMSGRPGL